MKDNQEQNKIDLPISASEWLDKNMINGQMHQEAWVNGYANYLSQYHIEKASELIVSKKGGFIAGEEKHLSVSSILSTAKEYVELNIKR